jgi:hypothetical protein
MRRLAVVVSTILMAIALPSTAALADDNPCSGQAPGPHCRPMDCEIVWEKPIDSDIVPFPGVPTYRCYN